MTAIVHVLVIVTRRIGDVLLATPLIRALKRAWPQAAIDALVFRGTAGVLAANPDLRSVLEIDARPALGSHLALLARIARRYHLALSLVGSDRPTFYAWLAGRRRYGILLDAPGQRWKQRLLHGFAPLDATGTHTVRMHLALADLAGVARCHEVVVEWTAGDEAQVATLTGDAGAAFAVLHPHPRYRYKMWRDEHWVALGRQFARQGLRVVLTGGPDAEERASVAAIADALGRDALDLCGRLSLAQTACLIARARVFVGPDTATTHVAAAVGTPTVALFGPTDPVKWGPWPKHWTADANPWRRLGTQSCGNVTLLQGPGACVPCLQEGCARHVDSVADCLLAIPVEQVARAADDIMRRAAA